MGRSQKRDVCMDIRRYEDKFEYYGGMMHTKEL